MLEVPRLHSLGEWVLSRVAEPLEWLSSPSRAYREKLEAIWSLPSLCPGPLGTRRAQGPSPSGFEEVQGAMSSVPPSAVAAGPFALLGQLSESHGCVFSLGTKQGARTRWENPAPEALKCSSLPGLWAVPLTFRCLGSGLQPSWVCKHLAEVASHLGVYLAVSIDYEGWHNGAA